MSSAISLAGQKWKEFWGTSKTQNPRLEFKKQQINEADQYVRMAGRVIQGISFQHSQMQILYSLLSQVLKKLDELEKTNLSEQIIISLDGLSQMHSLKIQKIQQATEHLNDWFNTIELLRGMLDKYQEKRLIFDHYRIKVDNLKKNNETKKTLEKLSRNQNKFEKSTTEYKNITNKIVDKMDYIINKKRSMINQIVQTIIFHQTEASFKTYKQLLKHEEFKSKFPTISEPVQQINQEISKKIESQSIDCKSELDEQENISIKDIPAQGQDWNPFEQNNKSPYQDEDQIAQSNLVSSYFSQGVAPEGVKQFDPSEIASFPSIYLTDQQKNTSNYKIDFEKFKQSTKHPFE